MTTYLKKIVFMLVWLIAFDSTAQTMSSIPKSCLFDILLLLDALPNKIYYPNKQRSENEGCDTVKAMQADTVYVGLLRGNSDNYDIRCPEKTIVCFSTSRFDSILIEVSAHKSHPRSKRWIDGFDRLGFARIKNDDDDCILIERQGSLYDALRVVIKASFKDRRRLSTYQLNVMSLYWRRQK